MVQEHTTHDAHARAGAGVGADAGADAGAASTAADGPATPDPWAGVADAIAAGRAGPILLEGTAADARDLVALLAKRLDLPTHIVPADTLGLGGDPVADTLATLRDSVFVRVRVMKKVYEGRIETLRRLGGAGGALATRTPPATLEVELSTDSDRRTIRLEGAFARAFWQSEAQTGDVVQIDLDQPLVVVRADRDAAEGFVAEERDLVYHVRLGDVDRAGVPDTPTERGRKAAPAAPLRRPVFGTGRLPTPGIDAMRATDRWVEGITGGKGTRLEPGVLGLLGAEALQRPALAVLREAVQAPASPLIILSSEDPEAIAAWARLFPHALRVP